MPKIKDKIYGELEWDELGEAWFRKGVEFAPNLLITIFIPCLQNDFLAVRQTHRLYEKIRHEKEKINAILVKEFHAEYNKEYRKKGDKYLKENEFLTQIKLDSITLDDDGTANLFFETDLFDDFTPIINLDKNGDFIDAELA